MSDERKQWEFRAEDFSDESVALQMPYAQFAADRANLKLRELIAAAPVVRRGYGWEQGTWKQNFDASFSGEQARLVCVEPIVRDTHESLLREFVRLCRTPRKNGDPDLYGEFGDLATRANKVIKCP